MPDQITPFQRKILERARDGEDRMIPEYLHSEGGRLPYLVPARRWYVPRGYIVPSGGNEYAACHRLVAAGLLGRRGVPVSKQHPYGLGAYNLTGKGRRALKEVSGNG